MTALAIATIDCVPVIDAGRTYWELFRTEPGARGRCRLATFADPGPAYRFVLDAKTAGHCVRGFDEIRDAYEERQGVAS